MSKLRTRNRYNSLPAVGVEFLVPWSTCSKTDEVGRTGELSGKTHNKDQALWTLKLLVMNPHDLC
jgi:hypothetical protein